MFPKPTKKNVRKEALRQYKISREAYLRVHPWCEVAELCTTEGVDPWGHPRVYAGQATEIHHIQGRGENYLNEGTWLAVCHECHMYIHANPAWAYEQGYMERRNVNEDRDS